MWTVYAYRGDGPMQRFGPYHDKKTADGMAQTLSQRGWTASVGDDSLPDSLPTTPRTTCWATVEEREVKGFPTKPSKTRPQGGFMRFLVPLVVIEVRATHWPKDSGTIKMSRSDKSLTVTFPNGEKQSMTPTGARVWAQGKFGPEMAETLQNKLRLGV